MCGECRVRAFKTRQLAWFLPTIAAAGPRFDEMQLKVSPALPIPLEGLAAPGIRDADADQDHNQSDRMRNRRSMFKTLIAVASCAAALVAMAPDRKSVV